MLQKKDAGRGRRGDDELQQKNQEAAAHRLPHHQSRRRLPLRAEPKAALAQQVPLLSQAPPQLLQAPLRLLHRRMARFRPPQPSWAGLCGALTGAGRLAQVQDLLQPEVAAAAPLLAPLYTLQTARRQYPREIVLSAPLATWAVCFPHQQHLLLLLMRWFAVPLLRTRRRLPRHREGSKPHQTC